MVKKINLAGVETEFKPVEPGTYRASVADYEFKLDKNGVDLLTIQWQIEEGDQAGRKVFDNYSLNEKSYWAFKAMAIALGADPDELEGEVDPESIMADLKGSEAVLVVGSREYEGKTYADVKKVKSAEDWG